MAPPHLTVAAPSAGALATMMPIISPILIASPASCVAEGSIKLYTCNQPVSEEVRQDAVDLPPEEWTPGYADFASA
jgi:hypothetical protein